jgi:phosphate transport system permease protein
MHGIREWFKSGTPWIWLNASAVSISLIVVFGLLYLIMVRGLGYFWPSEVVALDYQDKSGALQHLVGERWGAEEVNSETLRANGYVIPQDQLFVTRYVLKVGNRDAYGADFQVVIKPGIMNEQRPDDVVVVVRREWGNFYGYLQSIKETGKVVTADTAEVWTEFASRMQRAVDLHEQIKQIERTAMGKINSALERLRLKTRSLELKGTLTADEKIALEAERERLSSERGKLEVQLTNLYAQIDRDSFTAKIQNGRVLEVPFKKVIHAYKPNSMGLMQKMWMYVQNVWEFLSDEPREANTEGGVFPAIFGTVFMVLIMAILVTPMGVVAAVYLREYAKQGALTRIIRIAVNNLAGVPSIVYGVFGLGFFVYILGGNIDRLFFAESLPSPTFGTPGILWSSLTLALLTLPVVIVATEEGLSRIPRSIREGSLALGATKFETLWRTVLPMASPAIMTGLILAVARAAGEVAPLMLVGVVKLAPTLPMDGNAPFVHLDRKFMHLGFHIYDVGFQSPNVEAARPLVYATSVLLVLVILFLNLAAIKLRNHLREKYRALEG